MITDKMPLEKHLQALEALHHDTSNGNKLEKFDTEISKLLIQEREMFLLQVRGYVDKTIIKQEQIELVGIITRLQAERSALQNTLPNPR